MATDGTPWLRVAGGASASGEAPATLAIAADPTGLAPGGSSEAALVVTPNDAPQDARTVSVTLAVGNVWEKGGLVPGPGPGAAGGAAAAALLALARRRCARRSSRDFA